MAADSILSSRLRSTSDGMEALPEVVPRYLRLDAGIIVINSHTDISTEWVSAIKEGGIGTRQHSSYFASVYMLHDAVSQGHILGRKLPTAI